ncbi:hypothetical protein VM98_36240, partial [Streptomyces rubellomurinus subsp. indigoferus]
LALSYPSPVLGLMAEVIAQLVLGRLLDLGGGTGSLLRDLAERGPDFTGGGREGRWRRIPGMSDGGQGAPGQGGRPGGGGGWAGV